MTGRVTMLGISRWTEIGGIYRTVQRFFKEKIDWSNLSWLLIEQHLGTRFKKVFILVTDKVVVTKSGKNLRLKQLSKKQVDLRAIKTKVELI